RSSGADAVAALIVGYGLVAFRDPHGIRPAVLGVRETSRGIERMVASESVALDALGFELERDLLPGEAVYIDKSGRLFSRISSKRARYSPCIFEFVYFPRPDSIIGKLSVYKARLRMGDALAAKIKRIRPDHELSFAIQVLGSSRTAAVHAASQGGLMYSGELIEKRYIGRTFILPEQSARRASVRRKLNAVDLEFRGKNVLRVDGL